MTVNDNVGVSQVRFFVDGNLLGSDTAAPYSIDWDTTAETDGDHTLRAEAEDAAGNVGQSAELTVTVQNALQFLLSLTGNEEVPAVESAGSAVADLMIDVGTGTVEGTLTITGIDVTAAHIHDGFAGNTGPVLIGLDQDPADPAIYRVPAGATLDSAGIDDLLAAGLYLNAHTLANPGGELRAQILPQDFVLYYTSLSGSNEVPRVDSVASGRAGVTVNTASGAIVVQARVSGLDGASGAHVHDGYAGENGPVLVGLTQDGANPGRWSVEDGVLNAAGLDSFNAGALYLNVHSMAHPGGEIRGQIIPDGISLLVTELSGDQEVPAVSTAASGTGFLTHDTAGGLITINVSTRNLTDASAAHLHGAYGGLNGGVEIGLVQDGSDPSRWFIEMASLSVDQAAALAAGATYVNVHTSDNSGGEIRGQVIPDGILFATGSLEGRQEVPPVASAAGGTFAVTVDSATSIMQAHANTTGVNEPTAAHLHDGYAGAGGGVSVGLAQDPNEMSRWSATDVTLTADQFTAFSSGRLYVNVHTMANPTGEIRGQVAPPPIEVLFV
ncbi:MAG: CHRD domain-containing protein, partial [Gammaproteobacteria bacterium]|nr:CHRD domain-containing protein [Gammaproteobacteria bacterium]